VQAESLQAAQQGEKDSDTWLDHNGEARIPMSEPDKTTDALQALLEPLLDLLADKIVERLNGSKPPAEVAEKWLTPAEAAKLMGVNQDWLYRHAKQLPFAKKLSRKALRFNENGLKRWLASRK
jgi:excisionase family DNA binding protein